MIKLEEITADNLEDVLKLMVSKNLNCSLFFSASVCLSKKRLSLCNIYR